MILCCGEALIDMIPGQSEAGEPCFIPKTGGAAFNTAIALGRLGAEAGLFTGVSNDLFGDVLQKGLRASGVNTGYLALSDAPSTLAFVELSEGHAQYTFYSEKAADRSLRPEDLPGDLSACKLLLFGGISLCAEPTASTLQGMMHAQAGNCVLMMDPNIRPSFIDDEATYRQRLADMIGLCDILKISDEDLNWLVPDTPDLADQLARLSGDTDRLIFVTLGGEGAQAFVGTRLVASASAARVEVADTIGAGDTFNAGILHVLAREGALEKGRIGALDAGTIAQALEFAVRIAGVTVSRDGANPPWLAELTR